MSRRRVESLQLWLMLPLRLRKVEIRLVARHWHGNEPIQLQHLTLTYV